MTKRCWRAIKFVEMSSCKVLLTNDRLIDEEVLAPLGNSEFSAAVQLFESKFDTIVI
jgi:hypothetical protein